MSLRSGCPLVVKVFRRLRGGSQAVLAAANDGQLYVVKFPNNLQGPGILFNEALGSELYRAFALPVPEWKPVSITDSFIDQNPDFWIETPTGRLRPSAGLCFGSRYLGRAGVRLLEILPRNYLNGVRNLRDFWLAWLIDICAEHADPRQVIFREESEGRFTAFFIDHGHMFGGPKNDQLCHFMASRYWDCRVYRPPSSDFLLELPMMELQRAMGSLHAESLWREIKALPDEWINFQALREFAKCLDRLSKPELLRDIHELIVDSARCMSAGNVLQLEPKRFAAKPMPGIHGRGLAPEIAG